MVESDNHKIGDLVCWSWKHDIIGYITAIKQTLFGSTLYTVEWMFHKDEVDKLPSGLYLSTTHTVNGITNMKSYLASRLNKNK